MVLRTLVAVQNRTGKRLKDVQVQVAIPQCLGYRLEDEAIWVLPKPLSRDHGIEIKGDLRRHFLSLPNRKPLEVNILGEGTKDGKPVTIMGESKTQLEKRDVDHFLSDPCIAKA